MQISKEYPEIRIDTQGEEAKIVGHPVSVKDIVIWHVFIGQSTEEIATHHNLAISDVHTALAYYYNHKQEIDQKINVESVREVLRGQREQKKSKVLTVETPQTPTLQKSALIIGWCVQIFFALSLIVLVFLGIRRGISFILQGIGISNDIAETGSEIATSLIILLIAFLVWLVRQKLEKESIQVSRLFASSFFILLVLVGLPIFRLVLQVFGAHQEAASRAEMFVLGVSFMLYLIWELVKEKRKTRQ